MPLTPTLETNEMANIKIVEWVELHFPFLLQQPPQKMYIDLLRYSTDLHGLKLKRTAKALIKKDCIEINCRNADVAEILARTIEKHGAKLEVDWVRIRF